MPAGAKEAAIPGGNPLAENATADANPLLTLLLSTTATEFPRVMVADEALAVRVTVGTINVTLMVWLCVTPSPVPLRVRVATPELAAELADSVSVLIPFPGEAMVAGENEAVTPFGNPDADNAIADLNPFTAAVATVNLVSVPAVTVALAALGVRLNVGTATTSVRVVDRVNPPPVPLIVIVELFAATVLAAANVTVTVFDVLMLGAENFTVTPAGAPLALNVADELNPPCATIVIIAVPAPPGAIIRLDTFGESVNVDWLAAFQ